MKKALLNSMIGMFLILFNNCAQEPEAGVRSVSTEANLSGIYLKSMVNRTGCTDDQRKAIFWYPSDEVNAGYTFKEKPALKVDVTGCEQFALAKMKKVDGKNKVLEIANYSWLTLQKLMNSYLCPDVSPCDEGKQVIANLWYASYPDLEAPAGLELEFIAETDLIRRGMTWDDFTTWTHYFEGLGVGSDQLLLSSGFSYVLSFLSHAAELNGDWTVVDSETSEKLQTAAPTLSNEQDYDLQEVDANNEPVDGVKPVVYETTCDDGSDPFALLDQSELLISKYGCDLEGTTSRKTDANGNIVMDARLCSARDFDAESVQDFTGYLSPGEQYADSKNNIMLCVK